MNDGTVVSLKKRKNPFLIEKLKENKLLRQKKRARLIVRNISYKVSEDKLKDYFKKWSDLEEVNLLKRSDGKLVGCAFIQYKEVRQATKAILKANNSELLGRPIFVDWAINKNEYVNKHKNVKAGTEELETKSIQDHNINGNIQQKSDDEFSVKSEEISNDSEVMDDASSDVSEDLNDDLEKCSSETKLNVKNVTQKKIISNDVSEGCTVFIKDIPFDADESDLRRVCERFGQITYAIINRELISGHSKGTAFVKFKEKVSAEMCLQAGSTLTVMDEVLQTFPALSKNEIQQQEKDKMLRRRNKTDARNLYLAREGIILAGSKAAMGVSAYDIKKRHQLEQIKTQVLKNLNRFVSRNRLSIHNLPLNYDNDNLKNMIVTYTGYKPHECRVMRENKVTPEHPNGISKGFGFMSFSTHQQALMALRKLNNNPKIFGTQRRPIVAFSIEDRSVHKIKEKRQEKSKINNPTYKNKLQKNTTNALEKFATKATSTTKDEIAFKNKTKWNLDESKDDVKKMKLTTDQLVDKQGNHLDNDFMGTTAKPGVALRMRSFKKISEQSQEHMKRIKSEKKKLKQQRIKQSSFAERKHKERTQQSKTKKHDTKLQKDNLEPLINKYKKMLSKTENDTSCQTLQRSKWYTD